MVLDPDTAADLELPRLVALVDSTLTTPGAVLLAELLAAPLTDPDTLRLRAARLQACEESTGEIARIRRTLDHLGRSSHPPGLVSWVREELPPLFAGVWVHGTLALLAASSVLASIVIGGRLWFLVVALFFVNMAVHYHTRRGIELHIDTLRELGRLVVCARRLGRLTLSGLEDVLGSLRVQAAQLSRLSRQTGWLLPTRGGSTDVFTGVAEYISIAFLVETRAYARVLREVRLHQQTLSELFDGLGLIDALQSGASFRSGLERRCVPQFSEGGARLDVEGIVHPLLGGAVPNALSLRDRSCVISGSNMSGKSTFLRAVGLNAVLAQTLCVATASSYRASRFTIVSSMNTSDDLAEGRSFYFAEAGRILTMVRAAEGAGPTLCLVDELLRGTNSVERLAASEAILDWLAARQALVLVATHDMELVTHLDGCYDGYHFSDAGEAGALRFDHRLRRGASITRNAIRLLEYLGFPSAIVSSAQANVDGSSS